MFMKKLLLGIAVLITTTILCIVSAGAETYGDYEYTVLNDGTVEITDYTGSATELEIPSVIEGKKVTSIGDNAFYSCTSLTSIEIPDNVTSIGTRAFFYCPSLTSIIIPDNVTSISNSCFRQCNSLTTVSIPDSVTSIGNSAFYGCSSLTSIEIPESVTSIGDTAFFYCPSLTSITISDNVTSIGRSAFSNCPSLSSINVGVGNQYYSSVDGVLFNKDKTVLLAYPNRKSTNYSIPDDVISIGDNAFRYCDLISVTIPDSVTNIGSYAFDCCRSLLSLTIHDGVASIGSGAMGYCYSNILIKVEDFVLYCQKNTVAHQYALNNELKYILLDAPAAPSAVSGFKSPSKSTTAIRLNWTKNNDADGYIIDQYTSGGWVQIADITDNATVTYKVTDLNPGTAYKFRMRAYNAGGESKNTATLTVNTQMTTVKGFTSPSRSTTAIRLNWTKNAYADGYIIDQYTNDGWVQIADITDGATTTYKVTGLKSGTAYKFRMKAYSVTKYGETILGDKTATLTVNTQASSVTGFDLKSRSSSALRLKWTKNAAVDGYIIEQYIDDQWVQIVEIEGNATTEYKVAGLSASTKYKFRMKAYAVTKYGEKTYSPYTSTLSKTTNPSTVSGLKVKSKAQTAIRLAWSKNTSATGYLIEQYINGGWVQVAKIEDNATLNYRIDGLAKATTYQFRVRTYNMVGTTALYSDYKTISGTTNS